jgi:hypothetical protein
MKPIALITAAVLATQLAACGEKPQTATPRKADEKVWQSNDPAYTTAGYKAGDAAAWDAQNRQRTQAQNEYNRTR